LRVVYWSDEEGGMPILWAQNDNPMGAGNLWVRIPSLKQVRFSPSGTRSI
jgi:hypothetical protein